MFEIAIDRSRLRRWALLAVLAQLSVRALAGGIALVVDPTGGIVGRSTAGLAALPIADFRLPGLVLAVGIGGGALLAGVAVWRRHPRGSWAAGAVGVGLLAWIGLELAIGYGGPTIALNLATGLALVALALAESR
ncbi:hypothetical protein [Halococcoides cellulosivorans]|uniref:Uncharacterized protein n=1 Tax=Halococcoides cellulosivorans TaxID=1679096 RepID=A0A2R4X439_9EURY|nr:hypothetical protein [Halococcoides cellulosivorans]AWB28566.1 hypothetical protein HARCEL1_13185 [Halococcoides cellulosivorans]